MQQPLRFLLLSALGLSLVSSLSSMTWTPDQGDGTYRNPILFADYSDPDIVQVGDDFYMTASSFNCVPALPILHSKDLVNWELVNYAVREFPSDHFDTPQHGNGVWAPAFRYHDGWYIIFWGDPDRGIFRVRTRDPLGEWEPPVQVNEAHGNIDPCPLWDDDGKVYLVHAFANSRTSIKSVLQVVEMNAEGTELTSNKRIVFLGYDGHPTIEGPKFLKRNGWYYIFAPAGGVATGWQTVLRSRSVWGPYEDKIVMAQGDTDINGPHQGGYVELGNGEGWFVHFQERQPYGRIVHLQPVEWVDDWPVIGDDSDGDGNGDPFLAHAKPGLPEQPVAVPVTGDEFDGDALSLAWQWHASPREGWADLDARAGWLRLRAAETLEPGINLWSAPQLLLQKLPAPAFTTTTRIDPSGLRPGERGGLVVMGMDYAAVVAERGEDGGLKLVYAQCEDAHEGRDEAILAEVELPADAADLTLRCEFEEGGRCTFSWRSGDGAFEPLEGGFQAREGRWIGAKIGLFAETAEGAEPGSLDVESFRIE